MVVPAGVTKATGVARALAELGTSPHNAVAIGDAENDSTLLHECEVGMATANAVESLRRSADLVLGLPDGEGVVEALEGPVVAGRQRLHPRRWQLLVGHDGRGEPVTVPASQVNVLVRGGSHAGKSHLAGLLAEQLIHLGYSVLVLDPEGDHEQLATLPGVFYTGGSQPLLPAEQIVALLRHPGSSVVVDLVVAAARRGRGALPGPTTARGGKPRREWAPALGADRRGPRAAPSRLGADRVLHATTTAGTSSSRTSQSAWPTRCLLPSTWSWRPGLSLRWPPFASSGCPPRRVRAARRWTHQVRHWHKYARTSLPRERGFWFRAGPGEADGRRGDEPGRAAPRAAPVFGEHAAPPRRRATICPAGLVRCSATATWRSRSRPERTLCRPAPML